MSFQVIKDAAAVPVEFELLRPKVDSIQVFINPDVSLLYPCGPGLSSYATPLLPLLLIGVQTTAVTLLFLGSSHRRRHCRQWQCLTVYSPTRNSNLL